MRYVNSIFKWRSLLSLSDLKRETQKAMKLEILGGHIPNNTLLDCCTNICQQFHKETLN